MRPKILIIRNDHIGDMVLATQVFKEIKRYMPNSEITLIASKTNRAIIEMDRNIDRIWQLNIPSLNIGNILSYFKMSFRIRKEKFDYGIDMRGSTMNSFFLLYLPRIKNRISRIDWHPKISKFLTKSIVPQKEHIIKQNLQLVNKGLGINSKNFMPSIITDKNDVENAENFIKFHHLKKFICIVPGTGHELQKWKLENFDKVIKYLAENYPDQKVVLVGSSKDKKEINYLMKNKNCISLIDFNLRALSILFKKSKGVIALDGGPMHIAWVSGAKLIALLGPLDLKLLKPLNNSIIIHHKLPCNPCNKKIKECPQKKGNRCMDLITVEEVIKRLKQI
jgi:ADP-heptose:LPS heptosyltransferase